MTGGFALHFGHEDHTTAWHLARALGRRRDVECVGTGHTRRAPGCAGPMLWVESGRRSLPRARDIADRPTGGWLIDTHRGYGWRADLAQAFDVVFVAQRQAVADLAAIGIHVIWLPLAFPADLATQPSFRPIPVDFVGNVIPGSRRERLLLPIARHFAIPLGRYVAPRDMIARYGAARIVLNIPLANDLNMRFFEASGAGAHVVTGRMDGLDVILSPELCTVVEDEDPSAWIETIEALLSSPGDLELRAAAAQEVILEAHTYDHRAQTILDHLRPGIDRANVTQRERALVQAAGPLGLPAVAIAAPTVSRALRGQAAAEALLVSARRRLGAIVRRAPLVGGRR